MAASSSSLLNCRSTTKYWRSKNNGWLEIHSIPVNYLENIVEYLREAARASIADGELWDEEHGLSLPTSEKDADSLIHQVHPGFATMLLEIMKKRKELPVFVDTRAFTRLAERVDALEKKTTRGKK